MKTEKAVIKLALRATLNSDKTQSIVLRVQWQKKRADKTLPYSVQKKDWNTSTLQVKNSNHNAFIINKMINEVKAKAESIRDGFILDNKPYTARDIVDALNDGQAYTHRVRTLREVTSEYIDEMRLKPNTIFIFRKTLNAFGKCFDKDDMDITDIDKEKVNTFMDWLTAQGFSDGTNLTYTARLHAILSFAVEREYIAKNPFPQKGNGAITKRWHKDTNPKPLSLAQVELVYQYWFQRGTNNPKWERDLLCKLSSENFMLNFFMCGLNLQGLAPIDLMLLSKDMIDTSNTLTDRIIFNTYRKKTDKKVKVTLFTEKDKLMFAPYLQRLREGKRFLFPLFDNIDVKDEKALTKRMNLFLTSGAPALKRVWEGFNQWLQDKVGETTYGLDVTYKCKGINPRTKEKGIMDVTEHITKDNVNKFYINKDRITLYSYRHTYASKFIAMGGDIYDLAKDMGRSLNNIDTYIDSLVVSQRIIDDNRLAVLNQ
jgi:site-specific recombinase XerD